MLTRNSSNFSPGGISVHSAAQEKGVSTSTIYRWIKQGKILAKKRKGRYIVITDELFQQAQKYKRTGRNRKEILRENLLLKKELRELQQHCDHLNLLNHEAMERIAELKKDPPSGDFFDKSPDEVLWMFREYLRTRIHNNPRFYSSELPKDPDYWDCPDDPNEPDWFYDENTRTIEIIPLKKTGECK